jgi:hypothetical protein
MVIGASQSTCIPPGLPLVSFTSRPYRYLRLALKTHLGPVANESTSSGSRKSPVFLGLVKYEQGQRIKL